MKFRSRATPAYGRDLFNLLRAAPFLACLLVAEPGLADYPPGARDSDLLLNSTARLLAGFSPTHPDHAEFARREEWRKHSARVQASWDRLQREQITPLKTWRDSSLARGCPVGTTLLYPFSGPDFFNAYWLFPECETFVLFGLEHVGDVPVVKGMGEKQFAHLLASVRDAMSNLFARNYFVTSSMGTSLRNVDLHGVLPIIMISMAFGGAEIVRIEPLILNPQRTPEAAAGEQPGPGPRVLRRLEGVTIEFRRLGSQRLQHLRYFSVDASNAGAAKYPEFVEYLRRLAPTTTLIKSASYLLQGSQFRTMRSVLLDVTGFLMQDDTGFPYAMLIKRGWKIRVFGRYAVPIPPFERYYQPALADAYDKQKPDPLPFRFGYRASPHDERSNLMVGTPGAGIPSKPDTRSTGSAAPAPLSQH